MKPAGDAGFAFWMQPTPPKAAASRTRRTVAPDADRFMTSPFEMFRSRKDCIFPEDAAREGSPAYGLLRRRSKGIGMETTSNPPSLAATLDRLARRPPAPFPLVSLYLDARSDSRGKDNYGAFVRKELRRRIESLELRSRERESFGKDVEIIERWLTTEVRPSANGIAIFACSAANFFEALQLDAPIEKHRLT